jgi:sulfotransferase
LGSKELQMKLKHINFLCGLPRSGSTLLATLLNQHPKIYASPHSALLDGLWSMRQAFINSESVRWQLRLSAYQETLWTTPQTFYSGIDKEIIFDKQFCWSTPENYDLALKISVNPRFIVCYRPILDVLASFVSKSIDNPGYYLNKKLEASDFYAKNYLSKNDGLAEYLMYGNNLISKSILGLAHAKKKEDSGMFKFVAYDELVSNPEKEMLGIFDFLGLEPINVKTKNIVDIFKYKDGNHLGVDDFHKVRPTIKKQSPKPEDLFSDFILNKYANALAPIGL